MLAQVFAVIDDFPLDQVSVFDVKIIHMRKSGKCLELNIWAKQMTP